MTLSALIKLFSDRKCPITLSSYRDRKTEVFRSNDLNVAAPMYNKTYVRIHHFKHPSMFQTTSLMLGCGDA